MSAGADDISLTVHLDGRGAPRGCTARVLVEAPPARVWAVVENVEGLAGLVPMLHRVRRTGDRVNIQLRFKIALFSVGFEFTADATRQPGEWAEVRWVDGEPRDLRLRFDLRPLDDGRRTELTAGAFFDIDSLGWLAKYFLRHHPEIRYGVYPGAALALADGLRREAEGRPSIAR
jgi:hypothetical protein